MPFILLLVVPVLAPWTCLALLIASILIGASLAHARKARRRLAQTEFSEDVARFGWSDQIDPVDFEKRCAEAMRLVGWTADTTKGSGDQGIDVAAERLGVSLVIQCKRYGSTVGNKAVQQAIAGKLFSNATHAAVVTNAKFSASAKALASKTGVLLIHFTELVQINAMVGLPHVTPPRLTTALAKAEGRLWRAVRMRYVMVITGMAVVAGGAEKDFHAFISEKASLHGLAIAEHTIAEPAQGGQRSAGERPTPSPGTGAAGMPQPTGMEHRAVKHHRS